MDSDNRNNNINHALKLENRNLLNVDGVVDVISFDDMSVVLDTVKGKLCVNGRSLHIQQLNVENRIVVVDGEIDELIYSVESETKKHGLFGRLLS